MTELKFNKPETVTRMMNFLPKYEYAEGHHYKPTTYGIGKILTEMDRTKLPLLKLLSKHPNFDGEYKIVLTEDFERKPNVDAMSYFIYMMISFIKDNFDCSGKIPVFTVGDMVEILDGSDEENYYCGFVGDMHNCVGKIGKVSRKSGNRGCAVSVAGYREFIYDNRYLVKVDENGNRIGEVWKPNAERIVSDFLYLVHGTKIPQYVDDDLLRKMKKFKDNDAIKYLIPHSGQKSTKVFRKICTHFGIDKADWFNAEWPKFADAVNPLKVTRFTIISLDPIDFWSMSFGNDWASCHTVDKTNIRRMPNNYRGCYSAGTESYMLDGTSIVVYIVDKTYTGNEFELQPKLSRQMFHLGNDKLIQGRLYPQDNDNGADQTYKQLREIMQRVISTCMDVPNYWDNKKGIRECESVIESYGSHYRDYENFENCNVSYLIRENGERNDTPIMVGRDAICPTCGEWHEYEECILCESCADDKPRCEECGDPVDLEYGNGIVTRDDHYFCCPECAERNGYVYAEDINSWVDEGFCSRDDWTGGYYYYDSDGIYTVDGNWYHNNRTARAAGYVYVDNKDEWYHKSECKYCQICGEWVLEKDWDEEHCCCNNCVGDCDIKIGKTKIIVTNRENTYSNYSEWVRTNAPDYKSMWAIGDSPCNGDMGTLVAMAPHGSHRSWTLCGVVIDGKFYVIDKDGVKFVKESEVA